MIKFAIKWLGILGVGVILSNVIFLYITQATFSVAQVTLPYAALAFLAMLVYGFRLEFKK